MFSEFVEEVLDAEDANYCMVISEVDGLKRVLMKAYFVLHDEEEDVMPDMWGYMIDTYGWYLGPGIRMDCYKVFNGRSFARA